MEKTYKPNIGWLFWAHLILILVVLVPIMMVLTFVGVSPVAVLPVVVVLLLIVLISLFVIARTMYIMDDEKLVVHGAFKKYDIPYGSVKKIVDTNKFLVSEGMLVLSQDRIGIFFGDDGKVSLSPRDKQDAIGTLRSYCPEAEFGEDFKVKNTVSGTAEVKH